MKQINIKISEDVMEAINGIYYLVPPKNQRGKSINIFLTEEVDIKVSAIAEKFQSHTGRRGAPRKSKARVVQVMLEAFAISYRQGKVKDKDKEKIMELSKDIVSDLCELNLAVKVTKATFVSALVLYLCFTQKISDKLFLDLYNY